MTVSAIPNSEHSRWESCLQAILGAGPRSHPAGKRNDERAPDRGLLTPTENRASTAGRVPALMALFSVGVNRLGQPVQQERLHSFLGNIPPEEYEYNYYAETTGPSADEALAA